MPDDALALKVQRLERAIRVPIIASPTQIAGNVNDYETLAADILRLSTDASRNITGLAGGYDGRRLDLVNVGAQNIVLQNQNAGSAAANRVITGSGADITVGADDYVQLFYDGTTARWRVKGHY